FTYETDKASFDEESKIDGEMLALFFEEGDDTPCLANVCVIGEAGEDISAFAPDGNIAKHGEIADQVRNDKEGRISSFRYNLNDGRVSPRARTLAERRRVDLENAEGTGPRGRVIERDVQALIAGRRYSAAQPAAQTETEYEIIPLSGVRKIIAKAMYSSLTTTAQLTLNSSFDASDITGFRNKAKALGLPAASITDMIIYAVSRTLAGHKSLNAHFLDDNTIKIFRDAHIGVAVDTPRGLLVPTLFGASRMTLAEISAAAKNVYSLCADGKISPDLLQGASFTISNLGALGIESFTPVLNPPQTGILGVCSIIERLKNGTVYPAMGLSLTFDHRALDGADAARFLKELVTYLENFNVFAVMEGK
ncbi:MAG: 2-oxo acid dehydrogenase subunit E2, partial [Defluviitaleaceae bacterium]|nr:2-oxo acid dehydrogenase subunit E2 [Defluviitaleaceae bacterium]